jgi:hypothetical protein
MNSILGISKWIFPDFAQISDSKQIKIQKNQKYSLVKRVNHTFKCGK